MRIETLAVYAGPKVDLCLGALMPSVHLTTTFERDPDGTYSRSYLYRRDGNSNRAALQECPRELGGGEEGPPCSPWQPRRSSWPGLHGTTLSAQLARSPWDHVVGPWDVYHGTARLMREIMVPWGMEVAFVDMDEPGRLAEAVRPDTKLVWIEMPSTPTLEGQGHRRSSGCVPRSWSRLCVTTP